MKAVERLLGESVTRSTPLGGTAYRVETGSRTVVAKRGPVQAEAAGLRWLGEYGDVPVPEVLAADDEWLVTSYVESGSPGVAAAEEFGRGLAALHARGAEAFGAPPPGGPVDAWMGPEPMRNVGHETWASFYAAERISPYVRSAADRGLYGPDEVAVFEGLCRRLDELGVPEEPPARLHGDAWSGNVLWSTDGRVWLIDPAAHGGYREGDLAMLALFGTPQLDRLLAAYDEAAPLGDGWRERVGLHQLFPLLVHAVAFGGGYAGQALAIARGVG
ncbi:fructosamine kinase family protein [Amycolatopsis magusensis]|uniref:Fructosamine-3-kinase n=1 Tax=Amycolatopsis magusensis TaxID=882444 RepID=A0ABS4PN82_9PSEU|nr:fructosamine kinase family protein [Amycolatopsis magusensis]MBP2180882.1 fructosamine-3-kinase [Amycolatopsis magusensis]